MSYVIQNFKHENSFIRFVPRIKFFFFFKNVQIFYFFISQNFFFFFLKKNFVFFNYPKYAFLSFFFFNQLFKIIKKIDLNLLSFLDNRLTKSFIFWILNFLFLNTEKFQQSGIFCKLSNFFSFNNYLLPIKFLNTSFSNFLFKNIFFNLLIINSFFFFNNNLFTKHASTLLFLMSDVSIYSFYSGYFFNVYNI